MIAETCRDEPEGREAVEAALPRQAPATATVRSVQATPREGLADIHRAAAMVADLYALIVREILFSPVPSDYRIAEIARLVARDGMRASRLIQKAGKQS